jgi:tight adherence protein B
VTAPTARRRTLAVVLIFALAGLFLAASAQRAGSVGESAVDIIDVDSSNYPDTVVTVSVSREFADQDLSTGAFALAEGGIPRDVTATFLQKPIEVVLVIDTSGSMTGPPLDSAKAAAVDFLGKIPENANVAVVGFGQTPMLAAPLTTDRGAIVNAIGSLFADGETAMFDAVNAAVVQFSEADAQRFVVLLSDGTDTVSGATFEEAALALSSSESTFYAVELVTDQGTVADLQRLSVEAGGRVLSTSDLGALNDIYDAIAAQVANLYELRFEATSTGPVKLTVSVASGGELADTSTVVELAPAGTAPPPPVNTEADDVSPDTTEIAAPVPEFVEETFLDKNGLIIGATALFLGMSIALYYIVQRSRETDPRKALNRLSDEVSTTPGRFKGVAGRVSDATEGLLDRNNKAGGINLALDRAGINLRPGEYVAMVAGIAFLAGLMGTLMFSMIIGLIFAVVVALGGRQFVRYKGNKRRQAFGLQLGNTLLLLASSLRAGYGVQQALNSVADEAEEPTAEEFGRVIVETRIGRDLVDALDGVNDRLGNDDFGWVIRAIAINRELGGDLAEILDNVGETIRDRVQLQGQVKALTAEGRLSALVLIALPIVVAGFIQLSNPTYLNELFSSSSGLMALGFAAGLMTVGSLWIKKIINIKF